MTFPYQEEPLSSHGGEANSRQESESNQPSPTSDVISSTLDEKQFLTEADVSDEQSSPPLLTTKHSNWLVHPLPLWLYLGGMFLIVTLLVLTYLRGNDWANGVAAAGSVAFISSIILSMVWYMRSRRRKGLSPHPIRQVLSTVFLLALFVFSIIAQMSQSTLHYQQGRMLENQQQWQAAISEYKAGGESAPNGTDLARTYASWGLALNTARHYHEALSLFDIVFQQFPGETAQVQRAQAGDMYARFALAQQDLNAKLYKNATLGFDAILRLPFCDAACQKQASTLDAKAYYGLGETEFQTKKYTAAVATFDTLLSRFSKAPEAQKAYFAHATALLHVAEDIRSTSCSTALPYYQRLTREFLDTVEGRKAQNELKQPQDVSGYFTNAEANIHYSQIALVQEALYEYTPRDDLFKAWDTASLKTPIQNTGNFVFHGVPQGSYDLLWYANDGTTDHVAFIYDTTTLAAEYTANVGPLCPATVGTINNTSLV